MRTTITIGDLGRTFVERVPLFERSELSAPCTGAGLVADSMLGTGESSAPRVGSPRTNLVARRR